MKTETAYFGAGCFWGVEQSFRKLEGVIETAVGYQGGHTKEPTYEDVCKGNTAHAEVVMVNFDIERISFKELIDIFWTLHNPTQINKQGPDIGTQYRSVIFAHNDTQKEIALDAKEEMDLSGEFSAPIATQIIDMKPFFRAEEHHQQYFEKKGGGSCKLF